jgi:hypothetical protein
MKAWIWPTLVLAVASCNGAISGNPMSRPSTGAAGTGTGAAGTGVTTAGTGGVVPTGAAGTGLACNATPPPAQRLFLLDMQRYVNTLTDLLGSDAVSDLERTNAMRTDLISHGVPTLSDVTPYERLAEAASKTLTGAKLDTFVGCTGTGQTDACARKALSTFMARAFRRPVDATEIDGLMSTAYTTGKMTSFTRGVQLAVEAILQAGSTMYLKEIGTPGATPSAPRALDPYEVASQLSYFLLDSIPDADLTAAAASGALAQPSEVEKQVARLLSQPVAQQKLSDVVTGQYHLDDVLTATAVDGSLQSIYTDSLRLAFFQETQHLIDDVLWKNPRSYLELFTTNKTFVNQELATKVYGVPFTGAAGGWMPLTLPDSRPAAGILTQGSLLAGKAKANTGSVVKRGKSLRVNFLCLTSPPPPPTSDPAIKAKLDAQTVSTKSEGELAADRAADSVCKVCHSTFDPMGLALNQFDRVGRFTSTEPAVTTDLSNVDARWRGVTITGAADLGKKMSEHPALASCVASSVLRFATQEANVTADCGVQQVSAAFLSSNFDFRTLVKATATSAQFLTRTPGDPP